MINLIRRFLFKYCKFLLKHKEFNTEVTFNCNFDSMEEVEKRFYIHDNLFYNNNDTLFVKDMLEITDDGLVIKCKKQPGKAKTWQFPEERNYNYLSGCITTYNKDDNWDRFTQVNGVWSIDAIFPETWAAFWLLHPDYFVPKTGKKHIVPEVDVAESNGRGIDNVLHYGYDKIKYSTKGRLRKMHKKIDGKLHNYAVEILDDRYIFYLDGYRINTFKIDDPESIAKGQPYYLVLNNAIGVLVKKDYSEFIIKNIKVYK